MQIKAYMGRTVNEAAPSSGLFPVQEDLLCEIRRRRHKGALTHPEVEEGMKQ